MDVHGLGDNAQFSVNPAFNGNQSLGSELRSSVLLRVHA